MGKFKIGNSQQLPNSPAPSIDELLTMSTVQRDVVLNAPISVCECQDEIVNLKMDIELLKRVEPIIIDKNQPIQICPVMIDSRVRKYTKALRHEILKLDEETTSAITTICQKLDDAYSRIKELESKKPEEKEIVIQEYHTETVKDIQYVLDKRVLVASAILGIINAILIITLINK